MRPASRIVMAGMLSAAAPALAGSVGPMSPLVVDGQIHRVDTGEIGDPSDDASTVDTIRFTVTSAGLHTIDILCWEVVFDGMGVGEAHDLNGDGLHRFFDSEIALFRDDGGLSADDVIATNGDSEFPHHDEGHDEAGGSARHNPGGHRDGSIFEFDSFLRIRLDPGDYVLAVGAFSLSVEDAIDGLNDTSPFNVGDYPLAWDELLGSLVASDEGDYRATIRLVPAPGGAALLAIGAAASLRRRRS